MAQSREIGGLIDTDEASEPALPAEGDALRGAVKATTLCPVPPLAYLGTEMPSTRSGSANDGLGTTYIPRHVHDAVA